MSLASFLFTDRARPFVEIGVGSTNMPTPAAVWDDARWDQADALWAGEEPLWFDTTCDVNEVHITIGRQSTTDAFQIGRADVIVDNSSGWADFTSPPEEAWVLSMRPGRAIRIGIDHAVLGRHVLFRGFIDAMDPRYSPVDPDSVALSCIDALGEVNRAKLAALDEPAGQSESTTARVTRILDRVPWSQSKRKLSPVSTRLNASLLDGQVADLLGQAADSAGTVIFGDTSGRIVLRARDWLAYDPTITPDAVIGNVDTGDVCPTGWARPFARADITTRVLLNREGSDLPARVYDDVAAQVLYGIEPYERLDLLTELDVDLDRLGYRLLDARGATTAPRIRSVSINAATADNALDLLTTVDPYKPTRYLCRLVETRGEVFSGMYLTTGVTHDITPDAWSADINLDTGAPYEIPPTAARWDSANWDQHAWTTTI